MTLKTERRTQLRKRPLSLVYVELPPSNGGMMRDLSERGFSLRAMMPLQPSEKMPFSFVLDTASRIDGEAIVKRLDDGGHVAALEFAGLPAHSRDQIRRWLDKFDEPISPAPEPLGPNWSKHSSLTELRTQIRGPNPPPSAAEKAAPPPPNPEPPAMSPSPSAAITSPPPQVAARLSPEPPPALVSPAVESMPPSPPEIETPLLPEPPLPPVAESPQPPLIHTVMALPKPAPPPPQEAPRAFDPVETSPLPPLLKLSSVRPGALSTEIPAVPDVPVAISKPTEEPSARIPVSVPKPEPPTPIETRIAEPVHTARVAALRKFPPALEPLSSFEAETDSDTPGWMDRFTLGRAIGSMLFLTLLAGSYVYHREVGQALIWLGHEIAGDDSPESSKAAPPKTPPAAHAIPESSSSPAPAVPPPPLTVQQPTAPNEPKSANLPAASEKTPSPQLKGGTPGSLVPLTQVTRPPAPVPPADSSAEAGQQEYLEALQILRSPNRSSEVPAAIRLLWAAMEKGNTGAEIDLAELFRTGRGVTKNCDQTRILLTAAARKGSAEARKRLETFRREGCGN